MIGIWFDYWYKLIRFWLININRNMVIIGDYGLINNSVIAIDIGFVWWKSL